MSGYMPVAAVLLLHLCLLQVLQPLPWLLLVLRLPWLLHWLLLLLPLLPVLPVLPLLLLLLVLTMLTMLTIRTMLSKLRYRHGCMLSPAGAAVLCAFE
jgi:hypothetical protein